MTITQEDRNAIAAISARVPGWSDERQYGFFKVMLADKPELKDLLMLGVYHGRDIAFVLDILARYHPGRVVNITGVDRFSKEKCADWPDWAGSWEQLTHGMPAPSFEAATANTLSPLVTLVMMDDVAFLESCEAKYDLAYVDTSHDYESVKKLLQLVRNVCRSDAIVCGDDFSNLNGWGVERAVTESFSQFFLHAGWIWNAHVSLLK